MKEMFFKDISYLELCQSSHSTILAEGIMRNISVKLF